LQSGVLKNGNKREMSLRINISNIRKMLINFKNLLLSKPIAIDNKKPKPLEEHSYIMHMEGNMFLFSITDFSLNLTLHNRIIIEGRKVLRMMLQGLSAALRSHVLPP
jgi:hypothetical protein